MAIGYSNKLLASIRDTETYGHCYKSAGKLSIATALKNVSDTYDQLLADVAYGLPKGDCSEAVRDINHMIMRLEAIREAIK